MFVVCPPPPNTTAPEVPIGQPSKDRLAVASGVGADHARQRCSMHVPGPAKPKVGSSMQLRSCNKYLTMPHASINMKYMKTMSLNDNHGWFEMTLRRTAIAVGINPWGLDIHSVLQRALEVESEPLSRFRWGSPCRFIRTIDIATHVILPALLQDAYPVLATYLHTTSPRWGRTWRHW